MPIDSMMLDPMINPFKAMYEQCIAQGLSGEDVDAMATALNRMQELGQSHSDIMAYMGALTQENLQAKFSDHYGKALANQAKAAASANEGGGYDDQALLKQSLDGLRSAIQSNKDNYDQMMASGQDQAAEIKVLHDPTDIIKPIQDLIDLGEQEGMTLPRFLRLQIEMGLDKAMEGSTLLHAAHQEAVKEAKVSALTPYHIKITEEQLALFELLGAKNSYGVPNHVELSLGSDDIDRKYSKDLAIWEDISRRWGSINGGILSDLDDWTKSYCAKAPYWEPWVLAGSPEAARRAVKKTQDTRPGIIKEKIRLLEKYYGIKFMDIFTHPTFKWSVDNFQNDYSQEYTEYLIEQVYPHCQPFNHLPREIISQQEHLEEKSTPQIKYNPDYLKRIQRQRDYYDNRFGAGRFETKFGPIDEGQPHDAKPWNWATFKYGSSILQH